MPRVGKHNIRICGVWHELAINYTSRSRSFHLSGVPDDVCRLADYRPSAGDEKTLIDELVAAVARYHEAIEQTTPVLMVCFCVSSETGSDVIRSPHGGRSFHSRPEFKGFTTGSRSFGQGNGHGFDIVFEKAIKKTGRDVVYFEVVPDGTGGEKTGFKKEYSTSAWIEIPYTDERFEFFQKVAEMLREQALRIVRFLGQGPEVLALALDGLSAGKMLLPSNETE